MANAKGKNALPPWEDDPWHVKAVASALEAFQRQTEKSLLMLGHRSGIPSHWPESMFENQFDENSAPADLFRTVPPVVTGLTDNTEHPSYTEADLLRDIMESRQKLLYAPPPIRILVQPDPTMLVRVRTHSRRRIDKKYRKRYGYVRVPDRSIDVTVNLEVQGHQMRTFLMYRSQYEKLESAMKKPGDTLMHTSDSNDVFRVTHLSGVTVEYMPLTFAHWRREAKLPNGRSRPGTAR